MNSTAPKGARIVVVTGAGTGIGRATARAFAAQGAPEAIVRSVRETHGRLDVLVNNAGIVRSGAHGTLTPEAISAQ